MRTKPVFSEPKTAMIYTPETHLLNGLSLDWAECYGKPHIGAHYEGITVNSHRLNEFARCACCGKLATNAHHCPPKSKGKTFGLQLTDGTMLHLRPSLIALCGSGTTGCHNGFHGGHRFTARWVWDADEYAKNWWEGQMLLYMPPHSKELYRYGRWEITDGYLGTVKVVCE